MTPEDPPSKGRRGHKHEFSALWCHYGPYGPQDVHWHPCFDQDCSRILIAEGRECRGPNAGQEHKRAWLGEH